MGYTFSKKNAERIAASVKVTEDLSRGGAGDGPGSVPIWPGLIPATAPSGGISAGGSATVTLRKRSGTSLVADTRTVTAYNDFGAAVGASKKIWLVRYGGLYFVVVEACS